MTGPALLIALITVTLYTVFVHNTFDIVSDLERLRSSGFWVYWSVFTAGWLLSKQGNFSTYLPCHGLCPDRIHP